MANRPKKLETMWQVPDDLGKKFKHILAEYAPPNHFGRKRINARAALNAIIFRLQSGCQWNQLPNEFPDDSSVHRTFHAQKSYLTTMQTDDLVALKRIYNWQRGYLKWGRKTMGFGFLLFQKHSQNLLM